MALLPLVRGLGGRVGCAVPVALLPPVREADDGCGVGREGGGHGGDGGGLVRAGRAAQRVAQLVEQLLVEYGGLRLPADPVHHQHGLGRVAAFRCFAW